jgi:hypothetical protein
MIRTMSLDVVNIVLNEATIPACRVHLCEASPYFKKAFGGPFQKLMSVKYLSQTSPSTPLDCFYTGSRYKLPKVFWRT